MAWEKATGTDSLDVGALQVFTVAGSGWPAASSGCGRANAPFTSRPGWVVLGSETVSVASPAVEMTVAVVDAVYTRGTPGTNAPKPAGGPRVRASVAGTFPPAPVCAQATTE